MFWTLELTAIKGRVVVCHANLVMDFVSPFFELAYDIKESLFSCLTDKPPTDARLALRHSP